MDEPSVLMFSLCCTRLHCLFNHVLPTLPRPRPMPGGALVYSNAPEDDPYRLFSHGFLRRLAECGHGRLMRWAISEMVAANRLTEIGSTLVAVKYHGVAAEHGRIQFCFSRMDPEDCKVIRSEEHTSEIQSLMRI